MAATPLPGQRVRGSTTGRPIMALLDLLGRRWALRILWELRPAPQNFRELRDRCDSMSPSVLNQRLSELRDAGIVELGDDGYRLTCDGNDLLTALTPMNDWAKRWGRRGARRTGGAAPPGPPAVPTSSARRMAAK